MSKIDLTAQSGDWRWAGAMMYAGHRIRLETWADDRLYIELRPDGFIYWGGTDDTYGDVIAKSRSGLLWELYEEPAPAPEPKPVRWKLVMDIDGLAVEIPQGDGQTAHCTVGGSYLAAGGTLEGHRLLNFICIPPEGEDVEWRTGSLPFVFYDPESVASGFIFAPDDVGQTQLWATYADVLRVGGGK